MSATVLFVEDQRETRETLTQILRETGYRVTPVESADRALALLNGHTPDFDVIVTDIVMPGMDGVEFVRHLKHAQPDCRVIAISGGSATLPAAYGLQLAQVYAADALLFKPFTPEELQAAISDLLGTTD